MISEHYAPDPPPFDPALFKSVWAFFGVIGASMAKGRLFPILLYFLM